MANAFRQIADGMRLQEQADTFPWYNWTQTWEVDRTYDLFVKRNDIRTYFMSLKKEVYPS